MPRYFSEVAEAASLGGDSNVTSFPDPPVRDRVAEAASLGGDSNFPWITKPVATPIVAEAASLGGDSNPVNQPANNPTGRLQRPPV